MRKLLRFDCVLPRLGVTLNRIVASRPQHSAQITMRLFFRYFPADKKIETRFTKVEKVRNISERDSFREAILAFRRYFCDFAHPFSIPSPKNYFSLQFSFHLYIVPLFRFQRDENLG